MGSQILEDSGITGIMVRCDDGSVRTEKILINVGTNPTDHDIRRQLVALNATCP